MFSIAGMSCANCASKIERTLKGKPGVVEVGVSSMTNKARLLIDDDVRLALGPRDITEIVVKLGFGCELIVGGKIRVRG
jgi:copper chaperone CopZ